MHDPFQRVGIFGGSFDPVHSGHVRLAKAARRMCQLNRLYFVPARQAPHKPLPHLSLRERVRRLRAVCRRQRGFYLSLFEFRRPGTTYTVQTLRHFQKKHPGAVLYFVMGTDSLRGVSRWRHGWGLLNLCHFVVGVRPGVRRPAVPQKWKHRVVVLKEKMPDVSSTILRRRLVP